MATKEDKIIKEIEGVEIKKCTDGVSFMDRLDSVGHLTNIERLLFFSKNVKKYYYNFSEKYLRSLNVNMMALFEDVTDDKKTHYVFECVDPKDEEDVVKIASVDFASKIICFEDYHKVVTYDFKKKYYECFYVDMTQKAVDKFLKDVTVDNVKEFEKHVELEQGTPEELDDASDGIDSLCHFMIKHNGDVSGINITYDPHRKDKQIHIQITTSRYIDVEEDLQED